MEIRVHHDRAAQVFTAELDGMRAVLQYRRANGIMSILQTRVPQDIRGRGVAAQLTRAALAEARANGWTVDPVCSYASAFMRRETETERQHLDAQLDEALAESFPASDVPAIGGDH